MRTRGSRVVARSAFTLMEMLVVVAILVVLAGAGGVIYMKYLEDAKIDTARTQVQILTRAVQAYELRNGRPQSIEILLESQDGTTPPALERSALIDPWGNEYIYDASGQHHNGLKPDIYSRGPGGTGQNPIGNW